MIEENRGTLHEAEAGMIDKGDVHIKIQPAARGTTIKLEVQSRVTALFGDQIRQSVLEEIGRYNILDAWVTVIGQGALDYAIRARVQAALGRACGEDY